MASVLTIQHEENVLSNLIKNIGNYINNPRVDNVTRGEMLKLFDIIQGDLENRNFQSVQQDRGSIADYIYYLREMQQELGDEFKRIKAAVAAQPPSRGVRGGMKKFGFDEKNKAQVAPKSIFETFFPSFLPDAYSKSYLQRADLRTLNNIKNLTEGYLRESEKFLRANRLQPGQGAQGQLIQQGTLQARNLLIDLDNYIAALPPNGGVRGGMKKFGFDEKDKTNAKFDFSGRDREKAAPRNPFEAMFPTLLPKTYSVKELKSFDLNTLEKIKNDTEQYLFKSTQFLTDFGLHPGQGAQGKKIQEGLQEADALLNNLDYLISAKNFENEVGNQKGEQDKRNEQAFEEEVRNVGKKASSGKGRSPDYKVQSVLFKRPNWTEQHACSWLAQNKFKNKGVDVKEDHFRFRQLNPSYIKKLGYTHFVTKTLPHGIDLIIAYKK